MLIDFTVKGNPRGKGTHRSVPMRNKAKTKEWVQHYPDPATVKYEKQIAAEYLSKYSGICLTGAIVLQIDAFYPIPKSTSMKKRRMMLNHEIRPEVKPDASNVLKAVEDALNGIAYPDDKHIVDDISRKWYSGEPRVRIRIKQYEKGGLFK